MKTPREFIQEWMETVCSNNVKSILSLYKEDGILLGTLDSEIRKGHSEIKTVSYTHLTLPTSDLV